MLPAILFATVLIHWELMPRGDLIRSEQKKRARRRPILDLLYAPVDQLRADVLLVTLRRTECGSSVKLVDVITWREATWLIITVTNSRTLMEMSVPPLLLDLNRRVRCLTSLGKLMCHQKPSLME